MAIEHIIKNKEGKLVKVKLTFAKAIKLFCIECMGFQQQEVKNCTSKLCPLFKYKTGVEEKETKVKLSKSHKQALLKGLEKARKKKEKLNKIEKTKKKSVRITGFEQGLD